MSIPPKKKKNVLPSRKSPRLTEISQNKLLAGAKIITPSKLSSTIKVVTPFKSSTSSNKKVTTAGVDSPSFSSKAKLSVPVKKHLPKGNNNSLLAVKMAGSATKTDVETCQAVNDNGDLLAGANIPMPGLESMFDRFVAKVDEDRKIVIDEMKNVMMTKLREELSAALDESLQKSIASLKREVFTELQEKYDGELAALRSEIDDLKDPQNVDDTFATRLAELSKKFECLQNPAQSEIFGQCLKEVEERISRRKNVSIFGIAESNGVDANSRIGQDLESVSKVVREVSIDIDVTRVNCSRLGKFSVNLVHPRPFKVLCYSDDKAHNLIVKGTQMKSLPEASLLLKNCSFQTDLTEYQQLQRKQLKAELAQRRSTEKNPNLTIRTRNGVPKIVNLVKPRPSSPRPPQTSD